MPTFSHHLCNASFQVKLRRLKQVQCFSWKVEARYLSKDLGAEAVLSVGLSKFARQKKRVAILQFVFKLLKPLKGCRFLSKCLAHFGEIIADRNHNRHR